MTSCKATFMAKATLSLVPLVLFWENWKPTLLLIAKKWEGNPFVYRKIVGRQPLYFLLYILPEVQKVALKTTLAVLASLSLGGPTTIWKEQPLPDPCLFPFFFTWDQERFLRITRFLIGWVFSMAPFNIWKDYKNCFFSVLTGTGNKPTRVG